MPGFEGLLVLFFSEGHKYPVRPYWKRLQSIPEERERYNGSWWRDFRVSPTESHPKLIPRNYTIPKITFMVKTSSWNFHLGIFIRNMISAIHKYRKSSQNVSETSLPLNPAIGDFSSMMSYFLAMMSVIRFILEFLFPRNGILRKYSDLHRRAGISS